MKAQRRSKSIAMTTAELDDFLAAQRTCRVGTVSAAGQPHVTPLWFAWDGACVWLYSIVDSQRWTDIVRSPRVAVTVDAGEEYDELIGVEIIGLAVIIGDVPKLSDTRTPSELAVPERLFAEKYLGGAPFVDDGRHGWLRVIPEKITSWDFRKRGGLPTSG